MAMEMGIEPREECEQRLAGEHCTQLAVLHERVTGLLRAAEGRETRLREVESKLLDLTKQIDNLTLTVEKRFIEVGLSLEKRFADVTVAGWRQFWLLAGIIVIAAIGAAIDGHAQLSAHILSGK